ncbi:MAG: aminotransferase class V-fold PLP-dependent enzyme [Synechococcales cyanobacterium M58_A2018_015]|nr:aminotransferase class V-fold PLP-dependent enzyme [Synechococcales cyanobacterium M58_A2018_015]
MTVDGLDRLGDWLLDSSVTFLNHGSFGACPVPVLNKQQQLRQQMEKEPVHFFAVVLEALLDEARQELAAFVGASAAELAFVPNATTGVNTVLRSLSLQPGDELLTTNHEYNASLNALNVAAQQTGAKVVVADIPFPPISAEQLIAAVLTKVSQRTRLVLLDHVTSQTAIVFPIQPIAQFLAAQAIPLLVDGAHAPGMIPLNLKTLGVPYYTGNCHKWMCAPKGAAFLYVQQEYQAAVRPLVISHGANSPRTDRSRFHLEFDWVGTVDPTPYLCVPEAIRYLAGLLPGGWPALQAHNQALVLTARERLAQQLGMTNLCPAELIGSMASLLLPSGSALSLQTALFERFRIEVPVIAWPDNTTRLIRISAQLYNTPSDYDVLVRALMQLLAEERARA